MDVEYWADYQNDPEIGGFGQPYAPFGFNSYMDTEDVGRSEAIRRELMAPGDSVATPAAIAERAKSPHSNLKASVKNMDPSIFETLKARLEARSEERATRAAIALEEEARAEETGLWRLMDRINLFSDAAEGVLGVLGAITSIGQVASQLERSADRRSERGTDFIMGIEIVGDVIGFLGDTIFRRGRIASAAYNPDQPRSPGGANGGQWVKADTPSRLKAASAIVIAKQFEAENKEIRARMANLEGTLSLIKADVDRSFTVQVATELPSKDEALEIWKESKRASNRRALEDGTYKEARGYNLSEDSIENMKFEDVFRVIERDTGFFDPSIISPGEREKMVKFLSVSNKVALIEGEAFKYGAAPDPADLEDPIAFIESIGGDEYLESESGRALIIDTMQSERDKLWRERQAVSREFYIAEETLAKKRLALKPRVKELIEIPKGRRGKLNYNWQGGGIADEEERDQAMVKVMTGSQQFARFVSPKVISKINAKAHGGNVEVLYESGTRAYFKSSPSSGGWKKGLDIYSVRLDPQSPAATVAHEFAHAIEYADPRTLRATKSFLRMRANGAPPIPLKSLGNAYRGDEYAYEDNWEARGGSIYSGKSYVEATELLSMGLNRIVRDPVSFAALDPEYFSFVVQTLHGDTYTPQNDPE